MICCHNYLLLCWLPCYKDVILLFSKSMHVLQIVSTVTNLLLSYKLPIQRTYVKANVPTLASLALSLRVAESHHTMLLFAYNH